MTSGRDLHAVLVVIHKELVTGTTRSSADVLKDPPVVNLMDMGGTIPVCKNTVRIPPRTTTQVRISTGPSVPQIRIEIQKIKVLRRSIIPQEVSNTKPN